MTEFSFWMNLSSEVILSNREQKVLFLFISCRVVTESFQGKESLKLPLPSEGRIPTGVWS